MKFYVKLSSVLRILELVIGGATLLVSTANASIVNLDEEVISFQGKPLIKQRLPDMPIESLAKYFPVYAASYQYKVHDQRSNTLEDITEHQTLIELVGNDRTWHRQTEDALVEEWKTDTEGNILLAAKLITDIGYRVEFDTPVSFPNSMPVGYEWNSRTGLKAYEIDDPEDFAYKGVLHTSGRYEGYFEIKTPMGTVPAILISEQIELKLGLVKVQSKRYRFYSQGIGKVAEIEGRDVSALFFYRSSDQYSKVIYRLPNEIKIDGREDLS